MQVVVDAVGRIVAPKPLRDRLGLRRGLPPPHLALRRVLRLLPPTDRRAGPGGRPAGRHERDHDRRRAGVRHDRRGQAMTQPLALDTSVAMPLLVATHTAHTSVTAWHAGRTSSLSGHAAAETCSLLTRLPGDLRVNPADAARLLSARFAEPLLLDPSTARRLSAVLAELEIAGGAVYDAMVALVAAEHGALPTTRDARAKDTYERVGVADVVAA